MYSLYPIGAWGLPLLRVDRQFVWVAWTRVKRIGRVMDSRGARDLVGLQLVNAKSEETDPQGSASSLFAADPSQRDARV